MRRGTLIMIVVLFVLLAIAGVFQYLAAQKPNRFPGPVKGTPFPPTSAHSPSPSPSASA